MRIFFVTVLLATGLQSVSAQEWQRYLHSPETNGLNKLALGPDSISIGVGNDGVVRFFERTDSATITQTAIVLWPAQQDLFDVAYIQGAFYAVGRRGSLVRIVGTEIETLPDPTQRKGEIRLLEHLNGTTLIGGGTAPFQRSTDGLTSWQDMELPIADSIADMCTDGRSRWYVMTQRRLWTSSDGETFSEVDVPDSIPLVRIQAWTSNQGTTTIWCIANNGSIHISRNGGSTWSTVPFVPNVVRQSMPWATVYAFEVSPDGSVLVVSAFAGAYSLFIVSDDGGETWVDQNLENFAFIDGSPAIILDTTRIHVIKRGAPALAVKSRIFQDGAHRVRWAADNVTGFDNQFTRISFSRSDTLFARTNNGIEIVTVPNPTRSTKVRRSRYEYRTVTPVDDGFVLTMDSSYTIIDGSQIISGVNTLFLRTDNEAEASVVFVDTVRGGTGSVARCGNTIIAAKLGPTILTADVDLTDTVYRPLPGYLSRGLIAAAPDGSSALLYAMRGGEHHLLRSTDEGRTWSPITTFQGAVTSIEYVAPRHIFLSVMKSGNPSLVFVYRSTDGGLSFEQPELSFPISNRSPLIAGNGIHILIVVDTTIVASDNGGSSWTTRRMPRVRDKVIQPHSVAVTPSFYVLGTDVDLHYAPIPSLTSTQNTEGSSTPPITFATQNTLRIPNWTGNDILQLWNINGVQLLLPISCTDSGMAEVSMDGLPTGLYMSDSGLTVLKY